MTKKVISKYTDRGLGFPVVLEGVQMVRVRGRWTPHLDYNLLAKHVLRQLTEIEGRLTGSQVRFIRLELEMTLQQFSTRLGVTHPAVLKWERRGAKATGMNWSTEKDIRLFTAKSLDGLPTDLYRLYEALETVSEKRPGRVTLDAVTLAA